MKDLVVKHCKVCGEPLGYKVKILGKDMIGPISCKCMRDESAANKKRLEFQDDKRRLDDIKKFSMIDKDFETKTFKSYEIDMYNKKMYNIGRNFCKNWNKVNVDNTGFILYGIPGIGKTYLTACITNELISKGVTVVCLRADAIVNRIYESYGNNRDYGENEIIKKINSASLLILDDLGTEHSSKSEKEKQIIYSVIDGRLRTGKPLICTTNLDLKQLKTKMTGYDGVSRTYDRIIEMCIPIKVEGFSKRVLKARDTQKEKLALLLGNYED